ncbi:glycosyltransferase [Ensifer sp. ENS03]|uniref:glycosyltransferase family 2 protein n=1 Tax=Ensifer sp. ENS03 TaxID=2769283 RepID=UPI0017875F5A|nr:glycosyltransferase [Ensifer sp. ENS03]MBD9559597.1 glycosyltransferase [Ensifer sp. ENS03]
MTLTVTPIQDLARKADTAKRETCWEADGEDPGFRIEFSVVRRRFVVLYLASLSDTIDPKIYINNGLGFREQDARELGAGQAFAIKIDVGSFGTICSLRVDPCTGPALFSFDVRDFSTQREVASFVRELERRHRDLAIVELGKLPRFWRRWRPTKVGGKRSATVRYLDSMYAMAEVSLTRAEILGREPWLSVIVPVYNAPVRYLSDLLNSFREQLDEDVELILSDDASTSPETRQWLLGLNNSDKVRVVMNPENRGIAATTNAGIKEARGKWIALLDHDDVIAPWALYVIRQVLEGDPTIEFLYTDEVIVDENLQPTGLMLKPAYDPVLLSGVNYINHFSVYKRERLNAVGLQRLGFEGSQDYDLLLRYLSDLPESSIVHLPYPAYWWRQSNKSFSKKFIGKATDSARRALCEAFSSPDRQIEVGEAITKTLHRIEFQIQNDNWPSITVIIPSKNSFKLIERVLSDLYLKTDYPALQVIVVDNGTDDPEVLKLYEYYRTYHPDSFIVDFCVEEFNFARSVNRGMKLASSEHLLLLNNDVEVIHSDWLKEMVSCLQFDDVGIVGAKLLYPNDTIQHAGVIAGFGGLAGHWFLNKHKNFSGPMNRLSVRQSMTCVTGAVMLVSGACAKMLGEWDEHNFAVAYNDVDYCIRAYKAGYRAVWTPFACLYHHESVSRGPDHGGVKGKRFEREKQNLRRLHQTEAFSDPAINPGYSKDRSDPIVSIPDQLHKPRRWFQ